MKLTENKYVLIGAAVILVAFIIFAGNNAMDNTKSIRELKKEKQELEVAIAKSNVTLDSLKNEIVISNSEYEKLLQVKSKVITNYEIKIQEAANPTIVSNDSITKYIASKIHNR